MKVKSVVNYVKSGVDFEKHMIKKLAFLAPCLCISFEFLVAKFRPGVFWIFPSAAFFFSAIAIILILFLEKDPRITKRRVMFNLILSAEYLVNMWVLSLLYFFMEFGANWLAVFVVLPSFITGMLIPIKIHKDLDKKDTTSIRKTTAGAISSVAITAVIVGILAGAIGREYAKIAFADMSQVVAIGFMLVFTGVLSCFFIVGTINNAVKLYWLGRLEKRGIDAD